MIYGSVCSGIEAATMAWNSLGWKAAWYSEIEPFPCAVLKRHYPDVPNLGDMTKIHDKGRRPSYTAFIEGPERQIAYAVETMLSRSVEDYMKRLGDLVPEFTEPKGPVDF